MKLLQLYKNRTVNMMMCPSHDCIERSEKRTQKDLEANSHGSEPSESPSFLE